MKPSLHSETTHRNPPSRYSHEIEKEKIDAIDSVMTNLHRQGLFTGLIGVADSTGIRYAKGFSPASLRQGLDSNPEYTFHIASLTKQFVAALVLKLAEQKKLSLQKDFTDYLPQYKQDSWQGITLHHLLSQTSGIPDYMSPLNLFGNSGAEANYFSPETLVTSVRNLPVGFKPGEKFGYSNTNYVLLGLVVEEVTGISYAEALDNLLLTPLQLHHTGANTSQHSSRPQTLTYYWQGNELLNSPPLDFSCAYAAGDMYSTISDLVAWQHALDSGHVLGAKSLVSMYMPYRQVEKFPFKECEGSGYGYGVFVREVAMPAGPMEKMVTAGGYLPKSTIANFIRFPECGLQIISLENAISVETTGKYFYPAQIIDILLQPA